MIAKPTLTPRGSVTDAGSRSELQPRGTGRLFRSFFMGGFECSSHLRWPGGPRLDLNATTRHDVFARQDYAALQRFGIRTVRDGIRWHRVELSPGSYSWSSELPMIRAALRMQTQVVWDVCHYGWPEDLDPFTSRFNRRLASLARAFVRLLMAEGEVVPWVVPVNEISFLSWIGGTEGKFPPFAKGRGDELKRNLVRATLEAIHSIREEAPQARICLIDPLINVVGYRGTAEATRVAEAHTRAQFAAWDMIAGRLAPELGGRPEFLDVIGVNYYLHNQWFCTEDDRHIRMLRPSDRGYRPLSALLGELYERYHRPIFIAETGIEGRHRAPWLRTVCRHVHSAIQAGVPIEGICLYPITDYPGWVDDRHCPTGLLGYADDCGRRPVYRPLAAELRRQQTRFAGQEEAAA